MQSEVSEWTRAVTMMELSYVDWTADGQPRIPAATLGNSLEVDPFPPDILEADVNETLELLDSPRPDPITARDAAKAAMFLEDSPGRLTSQMASRLLSFDISMVRAAVARIWLRDPRDGDDRLLERVFNEQHPAVTQAAYEGVIEGWAVCNEKRRAALMSGLQVMADSPIAAAVLIGRLVLIARKEYGGQETPWALFEALMPKVLRQLPPGTSLRDDRLYSVMHDAIGNISIRSLLEIIDLWIDLVYEGASSGTPSDYLLGVSDILITGVPGNSGQREERVERLLMLPGTASRTRVVSDLVSVWDELTDRERRRLIVHLTTGDDLDNTWLQAAALTRCDVPGEIQTALLPAGLTLDSPPEEIIAKLPAVLLDACVHVFTGHHPVIYYVGIHGSRSIPWDSVLRSIARMPDHRMFEVAWEWLSFMGKDAELASVAAELGAKHAERLAGLLLDRKQHTTGEFMPLVWNVLFELPVGQQVKSAWLTEMAAMAPSVLDYLDEHEHWIPEAYRMEFLSHFNEDLALRRLLGTMLQLLEPDQESADDVEADETKDDELDTTRPLLKAQLLSLTQTLVDKITLKHWQTYDVVLRFLELVKLSDDAIEKMVQERRASALNQSRERPERRKQTLKNWDGHS